MSVKAGIKSHEDHVSLVPAAIAESCEVRKFAARRQAKGKTWRGEAVGWPTEYHPEKAEPPLKSKMAFTPADSCIGESGVWFFSLMWEHGRDAAPVEFLDDSNSYAARE